RRNRGLQRKCVRADRVWPEFLRRGRCLDRSGPFGERATSGRALTSHDMSPPPVSISLGAVLLLGACSSAQTNHPTTAAIPEGLYLRTEESYYDITGATAGELRAAMLSTGPRLSNWPLFAYTEWEVKWRMRPQARSRARGTYRGRCRLEYSEVDLTIR